VAAGENPKSSRHQVRQTTSGKRDLATVRCRLGDLTTSSDAGYIAVCAFAVHLNCFRVLHSVGIGRSLRGRV
jgi:hypothetical protein